MKALAYQQLRSSLDMLLATQPRPPAIWCWALMASFPNHSPSPWCTLPNLPRLTVGPAPCAAHLPNFHSQGFFPSLGLPAWAESFSE